MALYYPQDLANSTVPYISFRAVEYTAPYEIVEEAIKRNYSKENIEKNIVPKTIGTIYLPLPVDLNDGLNPSWEIADNQTISALTNSIASAADGDLKGAAQSIGNATIGVVAGDLARKVMGKTLNPKKQALFNGIDVRDFGFRYNFTALSERDANIIEEIVKKFRIWSLPSLPKDTDTYMKFPYEFEIKIHGLKGAPIYSSSVCTNVSIDLAPSGMQILRSGHPIQIQLNLGFRETTIKTRESPGM